MTADVDNELIVRALSFLGAHHDSRRIEAARHYGSADLAKHHQEQLYQIGEHLAAFGGRNAWPRPIASHPPEGTR